jgi:predicted secreted hydrolase
MFKRLAVSRIIKKRDSLIDWAEKKEVKVYKKLLSRSKTKLDPIKKKKLTFPETLYPLKNVPLEWWYFTGHLEDTKKKKRFGFEYCMFKFNPLALRVGPLPLSVFRKKPFLSFHCAITDKNNKNFAIFQDSGMIHHQDINYEKLNLSLENSTLNLQEKKFSITSKSKDICLNLNLVPLKKLVKHYGDGYTVMYSPPESRTYYLTFSRLKTLGKIKFKNRNYPVSGLSWFDHQKLNLPKRSSLRGWDWFSIMLNDNTELMFFILRNKKGLTHKFMGGTYINKNSKTIDLSPQDVKVEVLSNWKSSQTGVVYPSGWNLKVSRLKLNLTIQPEVKNQEITRMLSTPINYWEGACSVVGNKAGKKVKGQSYVELVGYDRRLFTKILQSMYR